jgi:hypothetical protein
MLTASAMARATAARVSRVRGGRRRSAQTRQIDVASPGAPGPTFSPVAKTHDSEGDGDSCQAACAADQAPARRGAVGWLFPGMEPRLSGSRIVREQKVTAWRLVLADGRLAPVAAAAGPARESLLRCGLALEYVTPAWNVAGIVVLAIAAIAARSVILAGFGLDSLIEIGASTVVIWELSGTGGERQRRGLRLIGSAFAVLAPHLLAQSSVVLAAGYHPAALAARDHLDRDDRRGDVRPGCREGPDRGCSPCTSPGTRRSGSSRNRCASTPRSISSGCGSTCTSPPPWRWPEPRGSGIRSAGPAMDRPRSLGKPSSRHRPGKTGSSRPLAQPPGSWRAARPAPWLPR